MRVVFDRKPYVERVYQAAGLLTMQNPEYAARANSYLDDKFRKDIGKGDVTTKLLVDPSQQARAVIRAKEDGIIAGTDEVAAFYSRKNINASWHVREGSKVKAGQVILTLDGLAYNLLITERTGLNFLQMMSGIATNTQKYVEAIKGTYTVVAATRKDWADEVLEKKAVSVGRGFTHRLGLDGCVLVKDNHLTAIAQEGIEYPVQTAIARVYASDYSGPMIIEVKNLAEAVQAAEEFERHGGFTGKIIPSIMLDNMDPETVKTIVPLINEFSLVEASGNVTLENIAAYAAAGVDVISTSRLNRGAKTLDLSQKIVLE